MTGVECRPLTLAQVRALPPIPSGFVTDCVYRLEESPGPDGWSWTLREECLPKPYVKVYDQGRVDDWLESYDDGTPAERLRFTGAMAGEECLGIATWRPERWNRTLWLMDIRVRADRKRTGVGSVLVEALGAEARRLKARGILVETQINNLPAINFYRKHSFRVAGFNDHLYTNHDREDQDIALYLFLVTQP